MDSAVSVRVFVSSVVEGFEQYRQAARLGIEAAGGIAVLVNEDFSALPVSPRNACLDGVASCDAFVLVVGDRGGWQVPSGNLVVEEEYAEAKRRNLPLLVFLEDIDRDKAAERFTKEVSEFVHGRYRHEFRTPAELQNTVRDAVRTVVNNARIRTTSMDAAYGLLTRRFEIPEQAAIRLIAIPERDQELVDPRQFEDDSFLDAVYRLAHESDVGLLSYALAKTPARMGPDLRVHQSSAGRACDEVIVTLSERGHISIEANVTGLERSQLSISHGITPPVVDTRDIRWRLAASVGFVRALYEEFDPYIRFHQLHMNVAIGNLGMRRIEEAPERRGSWTLNMFSANQPLAAFSDFMVVGREQLSDPSNLIERAAIGLRRAAEVAPA